MLLSLLQQLARLVWQLSSRRNLRYAAQLEHVKGLTTLPWKGPNGETVVVMTDNAGRMTRLPVAITTASQYMRLMDETYGLDEGELVQPVTPTFSLSSERAPFGAQTWN